ncbi:vascular endothelial zinc finger 1-like [Anopheles nili]|uniref:vascular endothelial zinc finger 1-like n=1 Tax=Anopheles nili TaxID=185578 RepID=UPI00237AFCD5|nr:vascular endothelial zinc finger 1-like [Anopheles nili]
MDSPSSPMHPDKPPSQLMLKKRRTRKTISSNDPAESLTEMSVRGLNLFRYATINEGMYQCLECAKEGIDKTFKNKYSFQRHAFLYHEGKQRKVFPCPVCTKEFSRPDKMKNHLRMTHELNEPKVECVLPSQSLMPHYNADMPQLHSMPLSQQHFQHTAPVLNVVQQLHDEQKRRQQEQDVQKFRNVVNAINLRQLQQLHLQQRARELNLQQTLEQHHRLQQEVTLGHSMQPTDLKKRIEPPTVSY